MNQLYLYLHAEAPLLDEPSHSEETRAVIGDFDTREPPKTEPKNDDHVVLLSFV